MKSIFNNFLIIFLLLSCSKPDLNVFEGKGVFLDDLKGKWIVFNYWADWCPPCIKEIPELKSTILEEDDKTKLMCLSGVKQYPMRVKCATLSWHTLISAMEDDGKQVSTED